MKPPSLLTSAHDHVTFLQVRLQAREHEVVAQRQVAARLADLFGVPLAPHPGPLVPRTDVGYAVPNDTLTLAGARAIGVQGEADLFGGVVPHPFMATKTITHPLIGAQADAPAGWQPEFAQRVESAVLPGLSAFSTADALRAALRLLSIGPVRIKPAGGIGGLGQSVASDPAQCADQLAALEARAIEDGVVIETNLTQVKTFSVGLLHVGGLRFAYVGTQRLTRRRDGGPAYGGSTITLARGDLAALEQQLPGDEHTRLAIRQARQYHDAAFECFAGMFASRCNYDIAQGRGPSGQWCSGVLEQSWRLGGASGAEIVALEALCADQSRAFVSASTVELHAAHAPLPDDVVVLYRGEDDELGPLTKYAQVHSDAADRTGD